jgi:hypothetical protein
MNTVGFLDKTFINKFKDGTEVTGVVLRGMQYRPDLVSLYYLGTSKLFWLINMMNDWFDVGDYIEGRTFIFPSATAVERLL